ncbi:MAG TPA: pyrimidine-nucleoside phosphorylase [Acetivibrio sp.]|nr:pyrimidine-nucleoside phosphorylase [Clostridium sp.]HOQ37516.1 pyrimidine-nucleoside phosphorylase [Acetivibrio sp.]HQA57712.1 pyrimidine-nucleoside phosphorylase [Acetivibrio sp.]
MRMIDLINKKKHGESLTGAEIDYIVQGYTQGKIPDYQMSAFLMAVYFKGMNTEEISNLTMSMVNSGEVVDLSGIEGIKVDKHSSGGVGDKLSLIIIPLCASLGIPVAKMSGRGLGHTGGTIDKLESIEGFRTELSKEEFINNLNMYNMAIVSQAENLTPADKKIYALRDVTGTVDSIPLIASSIMSKKIASGCDRIVLDVKVGSGAFMKSLDDAVILARTMVDIGKSLGKTTIAIVTDMNQPLGHEVGNANEVREAIEVLKGNGAGDVTAISLTIASYMAVLAGVFPNFESAYKGMGELIESGKALEKFKELVRIQGGNEQITENPDLLPQARKHIEVKASESGFINSIDAESIGVSAMLLGAGRKTKEDKIDPSAGITILRKVGDEVKIGDTLCVLHTNLPEWDDAEKLSKGAFSIKNEKPAPIKYVHEVIE